MSDLPSADVDVVDGIPTTTVARTIAYHSSRRAFERDRGRDVDLATRGVQVLQAPGASSKERRMS